MKSRRLLFIVIVAAAIPLMALVSSDRFAAWLVSRSTPRQPEVYSWTPMGSFTKELKTAWTNTTVQVYRSSGGPVELPAKRAVYSVWCKTNPVPHKKFDCAVTAFIDPATRNVWIGLADGLRAETNYDIDVDDKVISVVVCSNLFVETDLEIWSGDNSLWDGAFACGESLIKKAEPGEDIDAIIRRFDQMDGGSLPFSQRQWETALSNHFRKEFFASTNHLGNSVTLIQRIAIDRDRLRLDFTSERFGTTGTAWLDAKTHKIWKTEGW